MASKYKVLSVESDAKTIKGSKQGVLTGICYLAPANEAGPINLCGFATDECRAACLYGQGMSGVFPSIKRQRIAKTQWLHRDPKGFMHALESDVFKLILEASDRSMIPAVRINGTSDVPKIARAAARQFPDVQFYDYTKIPRPWTRTLDNYHLTFSFSGSNLEQCFAALHHGINVAVVFHETLPPVWNGYPVINGDESDLRFRDPVGVIVGLKAKGTARKMATGGFIQIGA